MINAGVIGGKRDAIIVFLNAVCERISEVGHRGNCDMAVVNEVAYSLHGRHDVWVGHPFTSQFKAFEKPGQSGALIIHK
jgi:hypothetical protein